MKLFIITLFIAGHFFSFSTQINVSQLIKDSFPRVYIPNPQSTAHQDSVCRVKAPVPLITGTAFRDLAHHTFDARTKFFMPDLVKSGDIVFVDGIFVDIFINKVFPKIANPFFLITSNGPITAGFQVLPGQYKNILENEKIIKWYSKNTSLTNHPKLATIPLGVRWFSYKNDISSNIILLKNELTSLNKNPKKPKKYLCTSCFRTKTNVSCRRPCQNYISENSSFIKSFDYMPFDKYVDLLKSSYFVISPPGLNIDCFRHWEALICGAYPIILHSSIDEVFKDLPVVLIDRWEDITKEFLLNKLKEFSNKRFNLEKLTFQHWKNLILSDRLSYLESLNK